MSLKKFSVLFATNVASKFEVFYII